MKKYLLLLFLFGIIFIPRNTFALDKTYEVNDVTYNTDTPERVLDYFYFTYIESLPNSSDYDFILQNQNGSYVFTYFTNDFVVQFVQGSGSSTSIMLSATDICDYIESFDTNRCMGISSISPTYVFYSTTNIVYNDNTYVFSNTSTEEILSRYNTSDSGGSNDNINIDFPITKNDFYALLILLGTIIMMLFFKWTFPMKGGRKL